MTNFWWLGPDWYKRYGPPLRGVLKITYPFRVRPKTAPLSKPVLSEAVVRKKVKLFIS